ncbi:membrane protein insertase YidC [Candidatus Microgenomates bacterium]|nr:membrane protein insertase YidC [Candidatus Microgenomates bacterium]
MWDLLIVQPLLNGLIIFYKIFGNLGVAIILFTVAIRLLLTPLVLPSLKQMQKIKELAPHLARLKARHQGDKMKLMQAQTDLYKQHGVNQMAGCLPQILQMVIFFGLFSVFNKVFSVANGGVSIDKLNELLWPILRLPTNASIDMRFLYLHLAKPDIIPGLPIPLPGIIIIASAAALFISSKMMMPVITKEEELAKKTKGAADDMAVSMQKSMLWMFPVMTLVFGFSFPSGLALFWFINSAFQVGQQYLVSGWGGMTPWIKHLGMLQSPHGR